MDNSYRYFENKACKYFPCHKGLEDFNCLFCYCPFYLTENCPGHPAYLDIDGKIIKDCSGCTFPHRAENYERIMAALKKANEERVFSEAVRAKAVPVRRVKK